MNAFQDCKGLCTDVTDAGSNCEGLEQSRPLSVRLLRSEEQRQWDEFVWRHPCGTPFHLTAWKKSIEETFNYKPAYLIAVQGDRVRGVLPLFVVKNLFVKKALISSPFAVYGGVLADSVEVRDRMRKHLESLALALQVQYVELRNAYPEQCCGFERVSRYVTFTQEIGRDDAAILEAIPRKTRRMVRRSLEQNFATRRETHWSPAFLEVYLRNLHRLGTPAFPKKHFAHLLANFTDMIDIREVALNGKVVAAVLSFYFRDQVLPYYGASDPAANASAPNNYMYYDLMRWAGQNGYRIFDFGRSKKGDGGAYDFKSHWGMVERTLPYEVLLVKRKQLPHYSPANPRFRIFLSVWRHLPFRLTRWLGPPLVKMFP